MTNIFREAKLLLDRKDGQMTEEELKLFNEAIFPLLILRAFNDVPIDKGLEELAELIEEAKVKELVKLPNQALRKKSAPVKEIDSKIKKMAQEMVEYMDQHGADDLPPIGLAAPQLGELVRVIAFRRNPGARDKDDIQILINPTLVYAKDFSLVREWCLSIPGKVFRLRRAKIVKIRGLTLDNVERSFRGHDLLAQVFEHELDHLNGVLIDEIGEREK